MIYLPQNGVLGELKVKTIYATILGLTLMSGSAFAVDNNTIADDDAAIMNIGQTYAPNHSHMNEPAVKVSDDDSSIAQTGMQGHHMAHSVDVEAELFLPNDLPL